MSRLVSSAVLLLLASLLAVPTLAASALGESTPAVTAVWGCPSTSGNSTLNCAPGNVLTMAGSGFMPAPSRVIVGGVNCTNITALSPIRLTATLPSVGANTAGGWYGLQLYNGSYSPLYTNLVSYAAAQPAANVSATIWRVTGCASQRGNSTIGCLAGTRITVWGANMPTSNFSLSISSADAWLLSDTRNHNSSAVSGVLPSQPHAYVNVSLGVAVHDLATNTATPFAYLLQYGQFGPWIDRVSGCGADGRGNSSCRPGDFVRVAGNNFTARAYVTVTVGNQWCANATVVNSTLITCYLPTPAAYPNQQPYGLVVDNGGYQSNTVMIGQPGTTRGVRAIHARNPHCEPQSNSPLTPLSLLLHLIPHALL